MTPFKSNEAAEINIEHCESYIANHIFLLRPQNYREKYPLWPGSVGIELEMLPIILPSAQETAAKPLPVPLQGKGDSLAGVLRDMAKNHSWKLVEEVSEKGSQTAYLLRVELDQGDNLTFEPGGQLEFSSKPYPCLSDAVRRVRFIQHELDEQLAKNGWTLVQLGINPWHDPQEIGLQMAKSRYQAMDRFFTNIGQYGRRMMRQTCTIQACVDFGPTETDMAKRFLASQLLAPFATGLFANSPFKDGQLADRPGFRSLVWRSLDTSRTGIPRLSHLASALNKKECVASYLEFVLAAKVVFVEALDYEVPDKDISFAQWIEHGYKGIKPTTQDFETHLSLLFPEVRPRGFLELRSVDSQARPWQIVPAAFFTGLLYDQDKLEKTLEILMPYLSSIDSLLVESSMGLQHPIIKDVSQKLMQLSWEGFKLLPPCFRGEGTEKALRIFGECYTNRGRTPADDLIEEVKETGDKTLSLNSINRLHDKWGAYLSH
ncbi:MAG: glutamate-cysteine ligase family protein [Oligoflexales bacterium]